MQATNTLSTNELKERKSPRLSSPNSIQKRNITDKDILILNNKNILLWRGLLVWGLTTLFILMLSVLIVFLYVLSRSPLTEEDLQKCREDEYNPESDVIQLTQLNYFNLTTQRDTSWLIELYSPLCAHCRRMRNAWEQTATELKKDNFFNVGKVNCKCEIPLCRPFALRNYPGIYLIENGEAIKYDSKQRTKESFISWVKEVSERYKALGYEN